MYNLIIADLFKLHKSLLIKVLLGITTVSAVLMVVMAYLIPQGVLDEKMSGIGFLFSDMNVMSILGAVIAGVIICGDFSTKTIHDAIASGYSRGVVIVSKAMVFFLSILVILLPYAIVTGIALSTGNEFSMGSVALGFLNLLTAKVGMAFSLSALWKLLAVMLTLLIVYLAQLSLCVPLALGLRKPTLVVAIYYVCSLLSGQLMGLQGSSPVFDHIFGSTPYGGRHIFLTLTSGAGEILKAVMVSVIFITVMLAITYGIFRRSEIK